MMERDWCEIQVEKTDEFEIETEVVGECNQNCLLAKELICLCKPSVSLIFSVYSFFLNVRYPVAVGS
jgi:hypothetical protein